MNWSRWSWNLCSRCTELHWLLKMASFVIILLKTYQNISIKSATEVKTTSRLENKNLRLNMIQLQLWDVHKRKMICQSMLRKCKQIDLCNTVSSDLHEAMIFPDIAESLLFQTKHFCWISPSTPRIKTFFFLWYFLYWVLRLLCYILSFFQKQLTVETNQYFFK